MTHAHHDWIIVGIIAASLIFFFMFVQHRTVTGKVVGTAFVPHQNCYSFTDNLPVVVGQEYLPLCPNHNHLVDYFELHKKQTVINCQGSVITGQGGAAFIPQGINNPSLMLKDCILEGFDGLYQNKNPVSVRIQ